MDASESSSFWVQVVPAWVGMITGCIGLGIQGWQHWKSGPRLKVKAWFHPEPRSKRSFIHVAVRNKGGEPTSIERIAVAQDGRRFDPSDHLAVDVDGAPAKFKKTIAPHDRVIYQVSPFDREVVDPPAPVRRLDDRKPAVVYVRAAAFDKEIRVKVRPLRQNEPRT